MSKFWINQPVNKEEYSSFINGKVMILKQDILPHYLPDYLSWITLDITDDNTLNTVHQFLSENYITDVNKMYRLDYSKEFIRWSWMSPEYNKELHLGIVFTNPMDKIPVLVGVVIGTPMNMNINKMNTKLVGINFLCIHEKLRNKQLAPLLIKEITRRSVLLNMDIALYTVAKKVTKPFSKCRFSNIYLNIKKLEECVFLPHDYPGAKLQSDLALALTVYTTPYKIRPMTVNDIDALYELLPSFMSKYKVYQTFSKDEIKHYFLNNIVQTYIIEEMINDTIPSGIFDLCKINVFRNVVPKTIIGMFSIYGLPSKLLFKNKNSHINFAHLYYYFYDNQYINMNDIIREACLYCKKSNYDIISLLNIMDYKYINSRRYIDNDNDPGSLSCTDPNRGRGRSEQSREDDYDLYYYMYNYIVNDISTDDLGVVFM